MRWIFHLTCLCFSMVVNSRSILQSTPLSSMCSGPIRQGGKQLVECIVRDNELLDYRELRNWTAADGSGEKFHVSIECFNGRIYLPWPYRARNVASLRVQSCHVHGMFLEWNVTNTIPDELKYLEISDITIQTSIKELYQRIINLENLRPDFDCGQQTLQYNLVRNVNYHFDITTDDFFKYQQLMEKLMLQDPNQLFIENRPSSYKCVYPNLRYLENSGNSNMAKLHFKILEESTEYPALEAYDLSNNSFHEIPPELRNIDFRLFPKLKRVDFSENNIKNIQLNFPSQSSGQNLILIDLSGNEIQEIPKSIVDELERNQNVLIDVRSNPLRCDCTLKPFRQYVINKYLSPPLRYLEGITCQATSNQNQVEVYSLLDSQFDVMFCKDSSI